MALAEAAKLIATLDLGGNFVKNLGGADKALGKFDSHIDRSQSRAFQAGQHIGLGIKNAAVIAAAGVGVLATNVALGVNSLIELEKQQAQTNAVLKSTKGAAGISADAVTTLSEKFESLNAIIGDEVIRSAENMLLTFTNIKGKTFEPALQAVLDMNTAMGKGPEGLSTTAIQVGKALNDPVKGLTALQKVGVTFDAQQKKRITQLVKEGKTYQAQQIILAELNKEFGGSFLAQGNTTAGKVAKFTDSIEDLQRALAKALLPAIGNVADALSAFLSDPQTVKDVENFGKSLAKFLSPENIRAGINLLKTGFNTIKAIATPILAIVEKVIAAFQALPPDVQKFLIGAVALNKLTGGGVIHFAMDASSGLLAAITTGVSGGVGGGVGKALATAGLGKLFVQPVFVTNPGFGTGIPMPGGGNTPEPIPGWNPNAGGTGGLINVLKNLPIIGLGISGAEIANLIGASVADNLKEILPKQGQGDVIGDVIKTTIGAFTGTLGLPNLISGISGLVGTIGDLIPLIGAPVPPTDLSQASIESLRGAIIAAIDTKPTGGGGLPKSGDTQAGMEGQRGNMGDRLFQEEAANIAAMKASLDAIDAHTFNPDVKLDPTQIIDLRGPIVDGIESTRGDISSGLSDAKAAIDSAKDQVSSSGIMIQGAASLAGYTAANASTAAGSSIVSAIQSNRPIIDVAVNISATTVQKTVTVTDRNGPSGGSATDDLRDYPH